jgi:protein-S-isoprenylcysteine O-methyltransferase Ste14
VAFRFRAPACLGRCAYRSALRGDTQLLYRYHKGKTPMNKSHLLLDNRIVLQRTYAIVLLAMLTFTLTAWQELAPVFEELLALIGWVFVGVGVFGRIWSGSYISGSKNAKLVVDGPYSICRNPLYFFSLIAGLGVMLVSETVILPIQFAALFWVYYSELIAREEAVLATLHGAAFKVYCARVPRFWPNFSLYSEPTEYIVSAALFRKTMADAIWFVIGAALIDFMEAMHDIGYLPTVMHIF